MAVPRVSVLMPVFNAEAFLAQCLSSIERQSMRVFECLIVDDGSTDASAAILDWWAREDVFRRIIHRPHRGLVESLNLP